MQRGKNEEEAPPADASCRNRLNAPSVEAVLDVLIQLRGLVALFAVARPRTVLGQQSLFRTRDE